MRTYGVSVRSATMRRGWWLIVLGMVLGAWGLVATVNVGSGLSAVDCGPAWAAILRGDPKRDPTDPMSDYRREVSETCGGRATGQVIQWGVLGGIVLGAGAVMMATSRPAATAEVATGPPGWHWDGARWWWWDGAIWRPWEG